MKKTEIKKFKKIDSNSAQNENESKLTIIDRVQQFLQFFTVEPLIVCFILAIVIPEFVVVDLNLRKACQQGELKHTKVLCHKILFTNTNDSDTNDTLVVIENINKLIGGIRAWKNPLESGIPIIVMFFFGTWTDRTGNRKLLMLLPIVGEIILSIILLLSTYYFLECPIWVTILTGTVSLALTGGWSIALTGCIGYISDVTSFDSRMFRVGIVNVIRTLVLHFGYYIRRDVLTPGVFGYYEIFALKLILSVIAFVYTYFRIHDVKSESVDRFTILGLFNPRNVVETFSIILCSKGSWKRLAQIWLIMLTNIVIMGPVVGQEDFFSIYTKNKYNMDSGDNIWFSQYEFVIGVIGDMIAITLFSKVLKMHDVLPGIISTASLCLSSLVCGLAPTKAWFYSGTVIGIFSNVCMISIWSLETKVVSSPEVGLSTIFGLSETITPVIYKPLFEFVFLHTINEFPGAIYVLQGIMMIPVFFIFIFIYILDKSRERDLMNNPKLEELDAKDNEITRL